MIAAALLFISLFNAIVCLSTIDGYELTPFGHIRAECHHDVPSAAELVHEDGRTKVFVKGHMVMSWPDCPFAAEEMFLARNNSHYSATKKRQNLPADYNGWLAYTQWENKPGIDSFLGSFSTPNVPKYSPDVLFIFTGLQSDDWIPLLSQAPKNFDIIQPVLQTPSNTLSSPYSIRSWYVTLNGGSVASDEVPVQVGDVIFGNMTRIGPQRWFVNSVNDRTQAQTHINVNHHRLKKQPWAFTTIECYGCGGGCDYLPTNECKFTDMTMTLNGNSISANWQGLQTPNPVCHTVADISDAATLDYTFQ